jgi:NitT/TauT family transport system substrate-binding protein
LFVVMSIMRHFSATLFRRGVAFAIGAAMVLLESGRASAGDVVRFQTDTFPSGEHAVYFGGWQKGIFAKHGIDITVSRGYGTVDTITKLPSGAFDFGLTDLGSVFLGRAREKLPVKAIAIIYRQSPSSIFVLKSSKITSLKDLEGKRIGGPPGGGTRALFPAAAALAGVDLSRVRWVNVDQAAVATQLIAKNIEAGTYYSVHYGAANAAAQQSARKFAFFRILIRSPLFMPT